MGILAKLRDNALKSDKSIILPKWIDDLIFKVLSAKYSRKNKRRV